MYDTAGISHMTFLSDGHIATLATPLQHFEGTAATLSILSAKALVLDPIAAHIRNAFSPRLENLLVTLIPRLKTS